MDNHKKDDIECCEAVFRLEGFITICTEHTHAGNSALKTKDRR
jgi:hypothetical protein